MILGALPPNPTLTARFAWTLQFMFNAIGFEWRRRGISQAMWTAISLRLLGLSTRLRVALEKWEAGTLRAARGRVVTPHPDPADQVRGQCLTPPQGGREKRRPASAWSGLPRGFGWLKRLLPDSGYTMNAFIELLNDPKVQAMIAAVPNVGRVVRPFCHFLGLPLPPELQLPKRTRARKKDTSPRPTGSSPVASLPQSGEGVWARRDAREAMIVPNRRLPPREQAEDAMRRSEASGKPIALKKFLPEAFGWWAHPPRDDNCPPPKIGYGGRLRPLPGDYRPPKDWE